MATTDYKGFTIRFAATAGRYIVVTTLDGFRADGYPTLNHAKGAITNYLKAKAAGEGAIPADDVKKLQEALLPAVDAEFWNDVSNMAKADEAEDAAAVTAYLENEEHHERGAMTADAEAAAAFYGSRTVTPGSLLTPKAVDEFLSRVVNSVVAINTLAKSIYARPVASRNKREGRYAGKGFGQHIRSFL
jgi:hypothetical protein